MRNVLEDPIDPVFLEPWSDGRIALRIGKQSGKDHGSRMRLLTPSEARILAYALLAEAERTEAKKV